MRQVGTRTGERVPARGRHGGLDDQSNRDRAGVQVVPCVWRLHGDRLGLVPAEHIEAPTVLVTIRFAENEEANTGFAVGDQVELQGLPGLGEGLVVFLAFQGALEESPGSAQLLLARRLVVAATRRGTQFGEGLTADGPVPENKPQKDGKYGEEGK